MVSLITNLIKLLIVLHVLRCVSTKQDLSEMGYNAVKRLNAISSRGSNSVSSCQVVAGPQTQPVNNSVSVDLIRQGGSI